MALEKKTLSFALLKGVDEKSSDSTRPPDALKSLKNVDFGKRGQLVKRGGFRHDTNMTLTKFGGGTISSGKAISQYGDETLILDGKNMYSWIKEGAGGEGLLNRGVYVPCTIEHEFKHVQSDRRQGNCQIAEKNGVRVYVWEEYEFQGTQYKTFVDIEHIASGSRLIDTTEISSVAITIDIDASAQVSSLYKQAQPQCAVIGSYIFIVYQEGGNMRYRSVNCTNITNAAAITSEANLLNASAAQVTIDTTYPIYQIDKFLGVTHSDAVVFAYYAGSNIIKVQYLTASTATLSMPNDSIDVGGGSRSVYFTPYVKATGGVPDGIFLKCLNDVNAGSEYSIVVGHTASDSGAYKIALTQVKDDLSAKVDHAMQNTLADGSSSGNLKLLRGTAGSVTDEGAIGVFVEAWSPTTDLGTQGKIVPEHFIRHYTLTRGSTTIATTSNAVAFNTSITSDLFRYNGSLYCVLSQVNDNALYVDFDAISPSGNDRGLNNNSVMVNLEGDLIAALRTGNTALCLTADYLTNNPSDFDSGRENRRLLFGAQRVTARETSTVFVFGASRHQQYAFHDPGVYGPGDYPDNVFGVSLFTIDFTPARTLASVDIENAWLGSGGFIHSYDGNEVVENNFVGYPAIKQVLEATRSTAAAGYSDSKKIKYVATYSWTDAKGNEHVSLPSSMVEKVVTPGKVSGISTDMSSGIGAGYSAGAGKTISATSGSGTGLTLTIGVNGSGAVTSATVDTPGTGYVHGNTVDITGGSSTAQLTVSCSGKSIIQVQLYVPSLTRKTGVAIKLYRTADDAADFYFVADIPVNNRTALTSSIVTYNDMPLDETAITSRPILYTTTLPGTGFAGCSTDLIRHQNKLISAGTDDEAYISSVIREGVAPGFPIGYFNTIRLSGDPGKITAIESNLDNLLVFTNNDGYYVAGAGPDILGQGRFSDPRLFASGQGALAGAAHTDSPLGVFYQSERGIHIIGRDMSIAYVGAAVEDTVGAKTAVSMTRRDSDNVVRVMLQAAAPGSGGADRYCIFNYYYKQWTTYEVTFYSGAYQVAEVYDGASFQRLTADGRVKTQSATEFRDTNQDGSANVQYKAEIMTGFISPTGLMKKDRIYRYMVLGQFVSTHTLEVEVYNDYDGEEGDPNQEDSISVSSDPTGLYLFRSHLGTQKSRGIQLLLKLDGAGQCANIEGFALEVGMRPDKTSFKTIASRTL